jgi:hypothetical protein
VSEDSLLEQVAAAAEERQLSQNSLIVYRRTWLKIIAWAAAEGLILETFPVSGEFLKRRPAARRSSGVDAAVPRAHQPVWPICTRPRSSFIPGGCVIRNQISSEQDGQKRLARIVHTRFLFRSLGEFEGSGWHLRGRLLGPFGRIGPGRCRRAGSCGFSCLDDESLGAGSCVSGSNQLDFLVSTRGL